jgi:hypothetical protein
MRTKFKAIVAATKKEWQEVIGTSTAGIDHVTLEQDQRARR